MYTADEFEQASRIVYAAMPPTPQFAWPLLRDATGCETWVKHENHTPTGAFKVRGGLVHMKMRKDRGETGGVITATRGNHGQSIPFAAARVGIHATIVCPIGNSPEKNAAMRALGAELIETGHDFDAARETAMELAKARGLARHGLRDAAHAAEGGDHPGLDQDIPPARGGDKIFLRQ